ncbi:MAG TPA: His/Gly/Thr/Pro-type tRNA ligase C-terminal domain-containing protein, partial [Gammaproteobacteria bacterium]|nr:His/Gly/Thr/Pro-type tRNA ligase C-terminal domain-containing protein [Gammaproteobacteria bacterium]
MPVLVGPKTDGQKFPGAEYTLCIEAMMQDGKALQAGTSHFLGQNFAKAFDVTFQNEQGKREHAWATSWGVSTRLIGGLIMTHADDDGFVLPPKLAPQHVVIIPIYRSDDEKARVLDYCRKLAVELRAQRFNDAPVRALVDERDERGGEKVWHWVRRGVPLRLEIGPRDIDKDAVFAARRDRAPKDKQSISRTEFILTIASTLQAIQTGLFEKAAAYRKEHTRVIDDRDEFYKFFASPRVADDVPTPIHAGFALTHFSGDVDLEKKIKDDLSVTVRCIPLDKSEAGTCPFTGKPSAQRVVWAKAY